MLSGTDLPWCAFLLPNAAGGKEALNHSEINVVYDTDWMGVATERNREKSRTVDEVWN